MVAQGGKVVAKLELDSTGFTTGWKNALKELNNRIVGPDLSGFKKGLSDVGEAAKKTRSDVDLINDSKFDKVTNSLDEIVRKVKGFQNIKPIDLEVKPRNIDETIRKIKELGNQGTKTKEEVSQINNSRFDKLISTLDGVIQKMRNTASSGVSSIKNDFNSGLNAVDFSNLSNKFTATIQRMQNTASSGVRSIVNEFSSMEAGLTDIFATVAGGAGLQQIFQYGMGRATTQTMLSNSKSAEDASTIMGQYQKYTIASSTQDTDIQRVLKYVIQGAKPGQTYQALSAIDAAAFTPDPVQRQELLRNYGQYLTNGYSAALFRGDVTEQEASILESAQTPEERIAAMEQIAKMRGAMTETGENLSTITTGPMANYNKALIIMDTLMRGMTDGFNKFMDMVSPLMDWFIGLDAKTQNTIGNLIFFAGILGMAAGAAKIFGSVISPFVGIFKTLGSGALTVADKLKDMIPTDKVTSVLGKLKDAAGNGISSMSDKVVEGLSGLKDKVSTPMNNFKDAVVGKFNDLKDWIQNKWNPTPNTGTTSGGVGGTSGTPTPTIWSRLGLSGVMAGTGEAVGVAGAASGTLLGILGGLTETAGGYGLQSIGNWLGKNTVEGQTGLGQVLSGNVANIAGLFGGPLAAPFLSLGGSYAGSTNPYKINNPFNINFGQILGQDWSRLSGTVGSAGSSAWDQISNFGGMLGKLLPGTSSAAGTGVKSSISNDLFGKNGALDFSRFGLKMPDIKWPNAGQILTKITDTIQSHIPKLNWKLPTIGSIGNWIQDKITSLGWRIPSLGSIGSWVQDKITSLGWHIPTLNDVFTFVQDKINWLSWSIPGPGEILAKIQEKIGEFKWPWGPSSAVTSIGTGSGGGGGRAFGPPRGPASDAVVATMAARSGVGSGYISQAMANRFSGLAGFTPIANGMADPLSYNFYYGDQKSNQDVWNSGTCNCYDGAQFLESEANQRFGLNARLQNGVWDGTSIAHTWSVIGGQPFDMAAKLLRGQWNPPSGPLSAFDKLMMDIGPGLEYKGYGGHAQGLDPIRAITSGANCFDMTLGVMNMASAYGLPSQMVWGTYDNNSHVWARVAGKDYDPTRMALEHTYSPPPQGPPSTEGSDETHVHIHYDGDVYGYKDFEKKTKAMVNKGIEEKAKKKMRTSFR